MCDKQEGLNKCCVLLPLGPFSLSAPRISLDSSNLTLTLLSSAQEPFPQVCSENTTLQDAWGCWGNGSTGYTVSPHLTLSIGSATK